MPDEPDGASRSGKSFVFYIDVFSYCNLRCPSCLVGARYGELSDWPRGLMSPELLGQILDKAVGECRISAVGLYNWTEPLLHPRIADLVRVVARYAARELSPAETGAAIAAVGERVVREAVDRAAPSVPLAVIGLGKLGREELSFASDLDVVFVFEGDDPSDFSAACRAAEGVMRRAREAGWRVDADLRPEGRSGPPARSLSSYLEYWSRWAETWEFQSLLGARAVAGDELLGGRLLSNASDFAYPEILTVDQVVAIRRMRVRMEEERVRPPEARRFHFKLGYGGLADVQFAVELSLMRFGFEHPEVRRRHTLEALEALAASRLVEASVAVSLGDAYVFLTEIKNMLEIERRLPADAGALSKRGVLSFMQSDLPSRRARHGTDSRAAPASPPCSSANRARESGGDNAIWHARARPRATSMGPPAPARCSRRSRRHRS
jgi:hypothetical protein